MERFFSVSDKTECKDDRSSRSVSHIETIEAMDPLTMEMGWLQTNALLYAASHPETAQMLLDLVLYERGAPQLDRLGVIDDYRRTLPGQIGTEMYRDYGTVQRSDMTEILKLRRLSVPGGICSGRVTTFYRSDGKRSIHHKHAISRLV